MEGKVERREKANFYTLAACVRKIMDQDKARRRELYKILGRKEDVLVMI